MSDFKNELLAELNAVRDDLWKALDALGEETEIYPGWRKREFFAHIAGWEAMVFDVFRRHLTHQDQKDYHYTGQDSANTRFVAVRQSTTTEDARLECEINRFALQTTLNDIDDYDAVIPFPWGPETVTEFIRGAIAHERGHLADILKLNPANG